MRQSYRTRRIALPPRYREFKPRGVPARKLKNTYLSVDEYEALRLADYEKLEHADAAKCMNISRPTFTRLVEKARGRIATAVVEGHRLIVRGGNVEFERTIRRCRHCGEEKAVPAVSPETECPDCGSGDVEDLAREGAEK
jgi:predicted DNA-binding protein (UPF0251 family)